jgi:hypothetical protein
MELRVIFCFTTGNFFPLNTCNTFSFLYKISEIVLFSIVGGTSPTSNIPPIFIVKPKDTTTKLGDYSAVLECVVNAR